MSVDTVVVDAVDSPVAEPLAPRQGIAARFAARFVGSRWHAQAVAVFCFVVLLLWWVGFYPGISTNDSAQQWDQARAWIFQNWHPVFHTWAIAVLTRLWLSPAAVTLTHIVALSVVLGSLTRRFGRACVGSG